MQTHEISIQPDDWKDTDPQEDRFLTTKWFKLESLYCVACGSRGLYTQLWSMGRESYLICIHCGVELISKEIVSARSSGYFLSRASLSKLRELDGVSEWKSSEHLEVVRPIFEGTEMHPTLV